MSDTEVVSTLLQSFQEIISRKDDLLENKDNEIERLKKDKQELINKLSEFKKTFLKYYGKMNSIPTTTGEIIKSLPEPIKIFDSEIIDIKKKGTESNPIEDMEELYKIHGSYPFIAKRIGNHPENSDIDKMNRSVVLYYNHENDQYYKFSAYSFTNELDKACELIYIRFENNYYGKRIIRGRSISTVRYNSGTVICKHKDKCLKTMCAYNHPEMEGESFIDLLKTKEIFNMSEEEKVRYQSYYKSI